MEEVSIVNILTILIIISLTWTGGAVLEAVLTEVVLEVLSGWAILALLAWILSALLAAT